MATIQEMIAAAQKRQDEHDAQAKAERVAEQARELGQFTGRFMQRFSPELTEALAVTMNREPGWPVAEFTFDGERWRLWYEDGFQYHDAEGMLTTKTPGTWQVRVANRADATFYRANDSFGDGDETEHLLLLALADRYALNHNEPRRRDRDEDEVPF
jgi:hypothetical protein